MKTLLRSLILPAAFVALSCSVSAQMQSMTGSAPGKPPASPPATATTTLGGKTLTIKYSAPSLRGRKMIGEHEPYGKVWRTGANPATMFTTAADLKLGTLDIPAGSYTIYSIPEAPGKPWLLIINKQTGQWGTEYHPEQDLGRTPMMTKPVAKSQEVMSISFENVHGKAGELHIRWADLDEYVKVEAK